MIRHIASWETGIKNWEPEEWSLTHHGQPAQLKADLWADLIEAWVLRPEAAAAFSDFVSAWFPSRTGIKARVEGILKSLAARAEVTKPERELARSYVRIWHFVLTYQGAKKTRADWLRTTYSAPFLEWVYYGEGLRWQSDYCSCNISGRRMCPQHGDYGTTNTTTAAKETDMFSTLTVNLINGTVGQVISQGTGQIVWQSEPFEDLVKEDGTTVKAADQAKEAANEAIKSAEMEMFAPKRTKRS